MSGEGTEQLGDLLLKRLRNNIDYLHELIERVVGDVEQAIVTASGDVLSKVVAAKILGEIAEDLRTLEDMALCEEYRDTATNAMLDAVGALLRVLSDLNAGKPLDDVEKELRGLQLTLSIRVLRRLPGVAEREVGIAGRRELAYRFMYEPDSDNVTFKVSQPPSVRDRHGGHS